MKMEKFVIRCRTRKEYDKSMRLLEEQGYKWCSGQQPTELDNWQRHKYKTCVSLGESHQLGYGRISFYRQEIGQFGKIISLKEYLMKGEVEFRKGDRVKHKNTGIKDIVKSVPGMREYDTADYCGADEGMELRDVGWEYQKDWKLIKRGENMNKYLVCWEDDGDPWESFETEDAAIEKVEDLLGNGVDESDIRVFEVRKEFKITRKEVELEEV